MWNETIRQKQFNRIEPFFNQFHINSIRLNFINDKTMNKNKSLSTVESRLEYYRNYPIRNKAILAEDELNRQKIEQKKQAIKERERIRSSFKYQEWKWRVLFRDNLTCQKCGRNDRILVVHHKKAFLKLLDKARNNFLLFNSYDAAIAYLPLWDISNGITLCEKCHNAHHKKFRSKNQYSLFP